MRLFFGKYFKTAALFCMILVASCNSYKPQPVDELNNLPKQVDGASDQSIVVMQGRLEAQGVKVLTIGDMYLVSIPSALIFPAESPQINWDSYQLLNDIACYLRQFRKIVINVTAFSNAYVSPKREHALTLARARNIAEYLWSQEIDSRFIFTQGMGRDKPISALAKPGDKSPNSRIEITFRQAVA